MTKSQKKVVVEERINVRIKDLLEDLFLRLNLQHLLPLQHLQQDHHHRRTLGAFNQLRQHLLLQHQGLENTSYNRNILLC